jgi:hypothetical protein
MRRDLGPAIPAADHALREGKLEPLLQLLSHSVQKGLHRHFEQVMAKKHFARDRVEEGRDFVAAYVEFVHYVERLYEAATARVQGHHPGPDEATETPRSH